MDSRRSVTSALIDRPSSAARTLASRRMSASIFRVMFVFTKMSRRTVFACSTSLRATMRPVNDVVSASHMASLADDNRPFANGAAVSTAEQAQIRRTSVAEPKRCRRLVAPVVFLVAFLAAATGGPVVADEGMWLFNNPPLSSSRSGTGSRRRRSGSITCGSSSVRFNAGGSGSFVCADGLVMTNHHVGAGRSRSCRRRSANYIEDGFHADPRRGAEVPDLELNVLMSIEDVTERVRRGGEGQACATRQALEGPPGRHGAHREGKPRQDRAALRRRHALPGRRVPPLPLQEVHRRPPRLRPGAADRVLRRRPGQLRVPAATTSTSPSSASTRTSKPAQTSTTSSGARRAPRDDELVFVVRPPGRDRPAEHAGPARVQPRLTSIRGCSKRFERRLDVCGDTAQRGPEQRPAGAGFHLRHRERREGAHRRIRRA